jgi:muconate cycloisomerase
VCYGAAIPLADKQTVIDYSRLIKRVNINTLKLKMGKDYAQNKDILEAVSLVFGDNSDIKVDVNCAWDRTLALKHIPLLLEYKVKVLEQPMMPEDEDLEEIADLLRPPDVTLMADESVCTLEDAKRISAQGSYGMVNVRLSKCGGFRNSLKLIDYLRKNAIQVQIGCHLGESGLLSAAGRALCLLSSDAIYFEGSYDEFLLKENITFENVSFEPGGKAKALNGPGLGVEVNPQGLARLSIDDTPVTLIRP